MSIATHRSVTVCRGSALMGVLMLVALALFVATPRSADAATFDHERVISNDNMRHAGSMSRGEIQRFLDTQTGPLKSLITTDYAGVKRPASEIIYLACRQWSISPKVMLTMLQKEQSLLTRTTLEKNTLSRAVGAGCPNRYTNKYPGFGRQIWHGARLLDGYGEGKNGSTIPLYYVGIAVKDIYRDPKVTLHPKNLATYKLYVYNPSISGNYNFWLIYNRYFGSPFASPRWQPVFRFRKYSNGTFLYTTSVAEQVKLRTTYRSRYWDYMGHAFSIDNSATAQTVPLYRFRNKFTGTYSFITSAGTYEWRRSSAGSVKWAYQGVAFRVSKRAVPGAAPIRRYTNRINGGKWFTGSASVWQQYNTDSRFRSRWTYDGVAFYLPRLVQ